MSAEGDEATECPDEMSEEECDKAQKAAAEAAEEAEVKKPAGSG
jgi:hypothetical protein